MRNTLRIQVFGWLIAGSIAVAGTSAFADQRDQWRTGQTDESIEVRGDEEAAPARRVVEGVVESVSRSGNRFEIKTSRGEITVLVPVGIPFLSGNRNIRTEDLRAGDRVRVSYDRTSRGEVRATRIQVLDGPSMERRTRPIDGQRRREITREERQQRQQRERRRSTIENRENRGRYDREERGSVFGTVVSVNERLDTFDVRTDDGRSIRVDAYPLRSRRGFSLRNLQSGERVTLQGEWLEGGIFRVDNVTRSRAQRTIRRNAPDTRDRWDDDYEDRDRDRRDDDDEDDDEDEDDRLRR